jgi:Uma2 family endonuclease
MHETPVRMTEQAMAEVLPRPWTVDDFLAWEAGQPERYEFVDGVLRMMVGASVAHTVIKDNIAAALRERLRGGPCRALSQGPKVVTESAVLYPDVTVTCTPLEPAEDRVRAPTVIVEVLSRSTADYDRGAKGVIYRDMPSLQHYLLVAQDRRRVELYSRMGEDWSLRVIEPPGTSVRLLSIDAELSLEEIYAESGC